MGSLRIFITSPDEKLRLALILFLNDEPNLIVAGISDRTTGLLAQLRGSDADVLLLDWETPVQALTELFIDLGALEHPPKTIVFSSKKERTKIEAAGADYFISKDSPPDNLLPILNEIGRVDYAQ